MSTKRICAEPGEGDNEPNNGATGLHEGNVKRAKLSPLTETTLQDLPIEMLECILVKAIVMEVKDMKLAKSVWKAKADHVLNRLRTVCDQWNCILTTKFFLRELHRTLDSTVHRTIRLEIVNQCPMKTSLLCNSLTMVKDEIFCIGRQIDGYVMKVYNRNDLAEVKDVISLQGNGPVDLVGCNVSNCVYVGLETKACKSLSVFRNSRNEEDRSNLSPWLNDGRLSVFVTMSISANGSLAFLSGDEQRRSAVVSIYGANGVFQREILLSFDIEQFMDICGIILKPNGNFVMTCCGGRITFVEIDMSANIVRQNRSLSAEDGHCLYATFAGAWGRFVRNHRDRGLELWDSEYNPLAFSSPQLNELELRYLDPMHYDGERNEVLCMLYGDQLTIVRFIE